MKRNILQISSLLVVMLGITTGFSTKVEADLSHYQMNNLELCYDVPNENEVSTFVFDLPDYHLFLGKSYVGFKEAMGFKESRGDYSVINQYGYMGKYQFGKNTLKMIGIHDSSVFLEDTKLQEQAFTAYAAKNKWILRRDIKRYVGTYIRGVKITESGILAAAHLGGAGNVKIYLRSGGMNGFSDAFGTSIRYYLKKFSGYDTSFIIADKQASVL